MRCDNQPYWNGLDHFIAENRFALSSNISNITTFRRQNMSVRHTNCNRFPCTINTLSACYLSMIYCFPWSMEHIISRINFFSLHLPHHRSFTFCVFFFSILRRNKSNAQISKMLNLHSAAILSSRCAIKWIYILFILCISYRDYRDSYIFLDYLIVKKKNLTTSSYFCLIEWKIC